MKKKRFDEESFSGLATTRVKQKSADNKALLQCVFCGNHEKDLSKMSKKQKPSHKLYATGEYHTTLKSPNINTCCIFNQTMERNG